MPQRRQILCNSGKSGFIGYLMIRPPGPWRMYWKLLEGLVLWMDFNQCRAIDLSGHENNGTIYGAQCVQGRSGKALSLDGVDDYVNCGEDESLNLTNAITVAVWMKTDIAKNFQGLVDRKYNDDGSWSLYLQENGAAFATAIPGGRIKTVAYFDYTGAWHHIVATFSLSEERQKIYIDGDFKAESTRSTALQEPTYPLNIGRARLPDLGHYFNGAIDEVRIYSRALSEKEIKWLYEHT